MTTPGRHGAEGVRAAPATWAEAGGAAGSDEQRPVVGLRPEAQGLPPAPGGATGSTCGGHVLSHRSPERLPLQPVGPSPGPPGVYPELAPKPGTELPSPGGQEVSPDVDGLVGHPERAEDTVQGRVGGRSGVARHDTIFPEHLGSGWGRGGGRRGESLCFTLSLQERPVEGGLKGMVCRSPWCQSQTESKPISAQVPVPREQVRDRRGRGRGQGGLGAVDTWPLRPGLRVQLGSRKTGHKPCSQRTGAPHQ